MCQMTWLDVWWQFLIVLIVAGFFVDNIVANLVSGAAVLGIRKRPKDERKV